jgi:hypothetical protein
MKKQMMDWEFEKMEGFTKNEIVIDGEILVHAVNDEKKVAFTKFQNQRAYRMNDYEYVTQVIELHAKGLY